MPDLIALPATAAMRERPRARRRLALAGEPSGNVATIRALQIPACWRADWLAEKV